MKERIAEFWNYPPGMTHADLVHVGEISEPGYDPEEVYGEEEFDVKFRVYKKYPNDSVLYEDIISVDGEPFTSKFRANVDLNTGDTYTISDYEFDFSNMDDWPFDTEDGEFKDEGVYEARVYINLEGTAEYDNDGYLDQDESDIDAKISFVDDSIKYLGPLDESLKPSVREAHGKVKESLQNEDGWSQEVVDILEPPIEEVEELAYELRNTVRGAKTGVDDVDGLVNHCEYIMKKLDDAIDDLEDNSDELNESADMEDRYEKIKSKTVYDVDGFTTDYTLYFDHNENNYFTIFGDNELYGPEDSEHDWDFGSNEDEALEWFEDYEGFVDEDENEDDWDDAAWHDTADQEQTDQPDYIPELTDDDLEAGQWYESLNEARKPKYYDTTFGYNVIKDFKNGKLTLKNIPEWDKAYNGGKTPNPPFNTKQIIDYYLATEGKNESLNEAEYIAPKHRDGDLVFVGDAQGYDGACLIHGDISKIPQEAYKAIRRITKWGNIPDLYYMETKLQSEHHFEDDWKKFYDWIDSIFQGTGLEIIKGGNEEATRRFGESLNETLGTKAVSLDDVIKEAEKLAKDLPQDKWAKETREKYIKSVYTTYAQQLKPMPHKGDDGKEYVYRDDSKNHYKIELKYIPSALSGNLAPWYAHEIKINTNAPSDWQRNVTKMIQDKFVEKYEVLDESLNEGLLFRDNGAGLANKGYIFTLQELGKLYDEMKDSDPIVSEYKNFSEWMNDTVDSGLLEIVDERAFDESLNEDTVKQGNAWVNKGKEGTHGKFKTKKAADAQRKAMFAQGYTVKERLSDVDFEDILAQFNDRDIDYWDAYRETRTIWFRDEDAYDKAKAFLDRRKYKYTDSVNGEGVRYLELKEGVKENKDKGMIDVLGKPEESINESVPVMFCPKCASHDDDIDYLGQDRIKCRKCGYEGDDIELWIDGSFTMSDAKARILRKSGYAEQVEESVDDGWQEVSGRDGYRIFRKIVDGKGKWRAQKVVKGEPEGEPFDITYEQALGREPIEDKPIAELSKKLGKILLPKNESNEIKRYSDVVPKEKRRYWYFTTHGVQPGSLPDDVNIIEVRDGVNDKGTEGTFVLLDAILNTSELKYYDMKELAPKTECLGESLDISDEDFQQRLKNELQGRLQQHYKKLGYNQREIEDYIMPVYKTELRKGYGDDGSDALFIWVGAEVDYDELEELANVLNKVIRKYDKDAYFEPETTGRLISVLWD